MGKIRKVWSNEENDLLKKYYSKKTARELAILINRSVDAIKIQASKLKLTKRFNLIFSEKEFLDAIKSSNTYGEARLKLGYKYETGAYNDRFSKLIKKLKPNISHFSLYSRRKYNNTTSTCYYCGKSKDDGKLFRKNIYNGIDRVNNKNGYNINNCVACCKVCNYMKSNLGKDEFISHINKIYYYTSSKYE